MVSSLEDEVEAKYNVAVKGVVNICTLLGQA